MIELCLLGRLSLTSADGRDVRALLSQPRRLALLAYLAAATPQGIHRRDNLLALFWPELDQEHARAALRQALHVVRDTLGAVALTSRGDEEIGLDFSQVSCDVSAFERAIEGDRFREALDLYRGNLLEGFFISNAPEFERWLETERARLRETASRAARALAELYETRSNLTTAAHWARRALELAPSDEGLIRRLITLLDRHGDRAGALQAYDEFAAQLREQYDAGPAAETQAVIAAVRARERAVAPVRLPAVGLLPRLRAGLADRYRVERELARGRTATVFLARDLKHDRRVAIKVLNPELGAVVGAERFLREIQLAARIQHPHIVALHDSGETDGLLYFVMPYVAGESLRVRLDREPQLAIADAVRITGDVAQALGYAHGLGVVHRDIKPENILLEDGHALVADFGIARAITAAGSERLTETGIALGTPGYMSPEQGAEDGRVDGRSDLYALGCVAYEMLAGAPPFTGPTAQAILARHAVDPVAPIRTVRETVPRGVEQAVLKALAKVPADRYPGATEFAQALTQPALEREASGRLAKSRGARLALRLGVPAAAALALLIGFGGGRERPHPRTPLTSNAEAYDLYLRADMLLAERQNRENDSVAITLFERIVTLDPSFAAAQAGLARAYALRVSEFAPEDTALLQRAQVAAAKALRLDPNLAEAHLAQARLLWGPSNHFFHERAAQEDRRALSLNPNMDRAHGSLGNIYLHIGMLDEAIAELQKTLAISPREDNALRRIAEARAYQGKYEEALGILSQVDPEANPPYWYYEMAVVLLHLGRSDSAFAVIQRYLRAHPEDRGGVVTSARAVRYAMAGDRRRAEQDIQTAIQKGKGYIHFHHAGYHVALAYALLHQPDSAVQWLRRVADGGLPCYPLFERDLFLNNIRTDPGFVAFLREQKAQWERFRATL
jgi:serine/threonine protein kinase/DNA-binding SARP family transcriptional activator/Flp pilus assembly protein TadD